MEAIKETVFQWKRMDRRTFVLLYIFSNHLLFGSTSSACALMVPNGTCRIYSQGRLFPVFYLPVCSLTLFCSPHVYEYVSLVSYEKVLFPKFLHRLFHTIIEA